MLAEAHMPAQHGAQASRTRSTEAVEKAATGSVPARSRQAAVGKDAAQRPRQLALPSEASASRPGVTVSPSPSQTAVGMSHRDPRRLQGAAALTAAGPSSAGKAPAAQAAPVAQTGQDQQAYHAAFTV